MLYPSGAVHVDYAEGVEPTTRLESLRDRQPVATLTFLADDSAATTAFVVIAVPDAMRLVMESRAAPFRMYKGWLNYWPTR